MVDKFKETCYRGDRVYNMEEWKEDLYMFGLNPDRLREIRIARSYTVEALALQVNISKQAISKYEKGLTNPSPEVLEKLISVLNIPRIYLSKEDIIEYNKVSPLFFRTLKSTKQSEKELASIQVKWAYEVIDGLQKLKKITQDKVNIPTFDKKLNIIEKATYLREYWGLGLEPIDNLTEILEKNGIYILTVNTEKIRCDAYSQTVNGIPFVVLNKHKGSAVRWRFDLAHELGHLILHANLNSKELDDENQFNKIEKEANLFASNFLMPESSFGNRIISDKIDYFVSLKKEWNISIAAMIYRCGQLDRFNEQKVTQLQKQISKRQWRLEEPLDDEIAYEIPNRIRTDINGAVHDKNSADDFLNEVRLPISDIENLCSLGNNFFSAFGSHSTYFVNEVLKEPGAYKQLTMF